MTDYTVFYKSTLPVNASWAPKWDVFISAFNTSERVRRVYEMSPARTKHWLVHSEYGYSEGECPPGDVFNPAAGDEAEFLDYYFSRQGKHLAGASVCIDTTGFMRPHLMLLLRLLQAHGVLVFDALYSEPGQYVAKENTTFSVLPVVDVRPVLGFEGAHSTETSNDLLIIGSGYDDPLISQAAEHKRSARKIQIFGLPSLRPEMFQENVLRARRAEEAIGARGLAVPRDFFAPANDPFVVASVLQEIVAQETKRKPLTNLYLCPLATKPQALGFALFYLWEKLQPPASILFPFARSYTRETTQGLTRIWRYTVQLPPLS